MVTVFLMLNAVPGIWSEESTDQFGRLGKIALYQPSAHPARGVLFVSGDGGWAELDREVSAGLARRGIPVVGVNSLKYFWTGRTPEQTARDLGRIIRHYCALWEKEKAALIGYSLGADILPFAVNRLDDAVKSRVELIVLLGPGLQADFEFHLSDWLGSGSKSARPLMPEGLKLKDTRLLCCYGEHESGSLCPKLQGDNIKDVALSGAHHFGGNYAQIADTILNEIKKSGP